MKTRKRVQWIDIARGIAILAVVLGHTASVDGMLDRSIYLFHMPIFFVLSGYLYREEKMSETLKKGYFNILLPYLFTGGILILSSSMTLKLFFHNYYSTIKEAILSVFWGAGMPVTIMNHVVKEIVPVGAIWFLLAFLIAEFLFKSLLKMTRKMKLNEFILTSIFIILALLGITLAKFVTLPWSLNSALVATFFMYAGYLIKQRRVLDLNCHVLFIISIIICSFGLLFDTFILASPSAEDYFVSLMAGVFGSIIIIIISKFIESNFLRVTKVLAFYGRMSLTVLCFHLLDLNLLDEVALVPNGTSPRMVKVFVLISHYLVITFFALVIKYVPVVRSFYMHRTYKFKVK